MGWGESCKRCAIGRRGGCTFKISPAKRTKVRELLAAATQDSKFGKCQSSFYFSSFYSLFVIDLPKALARASSAGNNYLAQHACAVLAYSEFMEALSVVSDILENVYRSKDYEAPDLSVRAEQATAKILTLATDADFLESSEGQHALLKEFAEPFMKVLIESFHKSDSTERSPSPMAVSTGPDVGPSRKPSSPIALPPAKRSRQAGPSQGSAASRLTRGRPPVAGPSRSRAPVPSPIEVSRSRLGGSQLGALPFPNVADFPGVSAARDASQAKKRKRASTGGKW
jgi:hypothetical protein